MKIANIVSFLESIAPPQYQENYDNAQLITGNLDWDCTGALCTLDCLETTIDEAIEKKCNLIIAHHPIVFRGLKSLTGKGYVERTIIKALKNDIAIYAIHTNLDNVLFYGVNQRIAQQLELKDLQILSPSKSLKRLKVIADNSEVDGLRAKIIEICGNHHPNPETFSTLGVLSNNQQTNAALSFELFIQDHHIRAISSYLNEKGNSFFIQDTSVIDPTIGSGLVGSLEKAMPVKDFLDYLRTKMEIKGFKHTALVGKNVQQVALCGGAGSFLISKASNKADVFITSDVKYHEFFDADGKITLIDIGHYESEKYTIQLLYNLILQKFSKFAVYCTEVVTNPVSYYF